MFKNFNTLILVENWLSYTSETSSLLHFAMPHCSPRQNFMEYTCSNLQEKGKNLMTGWINA